MAAKKKAKPKSKPKKKKAPARKRPIPKKAPRKKKSASKAAPKAKRPASARAPAPAPSAPAATAPAGTTRVGVVTHYYTHLSVAIIQLENGTLREGDTVHIKGHTSDFSQRIDSMEVDHVHVSEVKGGQSFGLRVKEHAREHDVVYKYGF